MGSSDRLGIVLHYAKTPYINEREVIYRFFSEFAAFGYGRDILFKTDGFLLWITDRSQIIESDPEAVWRFSLLQQLISNIEQCKSHIGDHGYLRIKNYLSEGCFYCPPEHRAIVASEFD